METVVIHRSEHDYARQYSLLHRGDVLYSKSLLLNSAVKTNVAQAVTSAGARGEFATECRRRLGRSRHVVLVHVSDVLCALGDEGSAITDAR